MNGPQDVGGMMGFGPIAPETDEPIFHAGWEGRALGLVLAAGAMGHWNIDASRYARENRKPADYYASSYYEIWIKAVETSLLEHGFVSKEELAAGEPGPGGAQPNRVLLAADVPGLVARASGYDRPLAAAPRFAPGDRVRTRNINPSGHTRLPRYARGKQGTVAAAHGGFVLPDSNAHGRGEAPEPLYTIVFSAAELWGPQGDPHSDVSIDAWESYLERT